MDEEKLITLVRSRPVLWDLSLKGSRDREQVNAVWQEIGEQMGCDSLAAKRKWIGLKNTYRRRTRNRPVGAATLWDALSFLENNLSDNCSFDETVGDDAGSAEPGSSKTIEPKSGATNDQTASEERMKELGDEPADIIEKMIDHIRNREGSGGPESPVAQFFNSISNEFDKLTTKRKCLFQEKALNYLQDLVEEQKEEETGQGDETTAD